MKLNIVNQVADNAGAAATNAGAAAEQAVHQGISQMTMFWIALSLFCLFVAYFAVEKEAKKRLIGTLLSAGVAALAIFYISTLGLDRAIDLKGGSQFIVEIQASSGEGQITREDQGKIIETFRNRLDPGGQKNLMIAPQGDDRIIIQMPGISDEERLEVETKIKKTAKLEIVLVHPQATGELREQMLFLHGEGEQFVGYRIVEGYEGDTSKRDIVKFGVDLEGKHVTNARTSYGPNGYEIHVNLDGEGGKKMREITTANVGRRMAMLVDGKNLSAPSINEPFGDSFVITGDFEREEAELLATMLKNPLRQPVKILQQSSVSAEMGQESINQGTVAGIAGLALTLIFVLIYYKFAGLVATVGLTLNIVLIFGVMAILGTAISMPGIAGIVLTIGIAIDANVLIYERLREEQAAGKSLKGAINTAYGKAFSAIFDANVTTLIAALALFFVAAGTVKGFSVTLMIGVVGTLFSALLVTRTCFGWLTAGKGVIKALPLGTNPIIALVVTLVIGLLGVLSWRAGDAMFAESGPWGGRTFAIVMVCVFVGLYFVVDAKLLGGRWTIDVSKISLDFLGKRRIAAVVSAVLLLATAGVLGVKRADSLAVELREGDQLVFLASPEMTKADVLESLDGLGLSTKPTIQEQTSAIDDKKYFSVRLEFEKGDEALAKLRADFKQDFPEHEIQSVGPVVGGEMLISSAKALGLALIGIVLYVTFRFESFAFALGALVALVHDLIIVTGLVVLFGREISLIMVGALLTIAGYSINDTIVVFDRVREGLLTKRGNTRDVMNFCLNATLARTLLTSLTTLIVVVVLFFFGGPSLNDFALTLILGVLVGTYSSIFVASPIVLWWSRKFKLNLRKEVLDREAAKVAEAGPASA